MNRQIRRLALALLVCFFALFVQLNYVQVVEAHKLATAPGNVRSITSNYARPRGVIQTSDGVVLARSVPSNDSLKYARQYPGGALYGQITGYFSLIYGSDGVERTYNKQLTGRQLPIRNLQDLLGNRESVGNLTLTINSTVQKAAQQALGSKDGSVVVLNPHTGALLALYSNPSYDPTPLASHDPNVERQAWTKLTTGTFPPLLPLSYREVFPPGSTYKIIDSAAVYDHQPSLATKYYPPVSQIPLPLSTNTLHNYANEVCGGTLPELLKVSCDTGYGQVGMDLGAQAMSAEAQAFGFNQVPPIDLPFAIKSTFPPASYFARRTPDLAFAAIGQAVVDATPLQMALAGAAIANGGNIMSPHVMANIRDTQGNVLERYTPKVWLHATSAATAKSVLTLMLQPVQPGGTAPDLNIPGLDVAAKTGTAQTGHHTTDDWMVAIAPENNPQVVVAVSVPNQPPSATGDAVAGPITARMLVAALALSGIHPTGAAPGSAP